MFVKLFGGLLVAAAVAAAGIVGNSTPTAAPVCKEGACCTKDCCQDCPNCSCKCDCCKDCANGCKCPNMKK